MKKALEREMEKKYDAPVKSKLDQEMEALREEAESLKSADGPQIAPRVTSGDDLLDQAFKIALKKKIKKK